MPFLFESLRRQTISDWELIILDNGSTDNTVSILHQELENFPITYKFLTNEKNLGFAPGHNQIYRQTSSDYFLLLNQDIYLACDCLEKLKKFMDAHEEIGAVSPRLMRWDFAKVMGGDLANSFTNQIDALGLKIFRNRRVVEWLTKQDWRDDGKQSMGVFGVSGACPVYRRSAIDHVCFPTKEMFDESYNSYKEDVDLAYRLNIAGFESAVVLDAVAWHDRTGAGPKEMGDVSAWKNKQKQSGLVRYYSFKNHLKTLIKNEYWQNLILDFPVILWYELKKAVYFLFFDYKVFSGLKEVFQDRKNILTKRKFIKESRKVDWKKIRLFWQKYE